MLTKKADVLPKEFAGQATTLEELNDAMRMLMKTAGNLHRSRPLLRPSVPFRGSSSSVFFPFRVSPTAALLYSRT